MGSKASSTCPAKQRKRRSEDAKSEAKAGGLAGLGAFWSGEKKTVQLIV